MAAAAAPVNPTLNAARAAARAKRFGDVESDLGGDEQEGRRRLIARDGLAKEKLRVLALELYEV